MEEKQLSSKLIYKGKIIDFRLDQVLLPNGNEAEREVIIHTGGVVIIPLTQKNKFVLIEQFRYSIGKIILEFPAGRLDLNEDPKKAAIRELKEETGYKTNHIKELTSIFTAPGFCSETLYIYFASHLTPGEQNLDPDEFVKPIELTAEEIDNLIKKGNIQDSKTLAAWTLYKSQINLKYAP